MLAASATTPSLVPLYQGSGRRSQRGDWYVFGYWYQRTGRIVPLVIAHAVIDIVAFVGYALLKDALDLPGVLG